MLITRPREDAESFARAVQALGHEPVIEPLIDIVDLPGEELDLIGAQAVVVTSANGARALAVRTRVRDVRLIAVGPASAAAARAAGFTSVGESGGEGVAGLTDFITRTLRPSDGAIVHVSGSAVAGDLAGALAARGFNVRREVIYEARAVEHLSGALVAQIGAGLIEAATFFSPRTAGLFAALVREEGLEPAVRRMTALCLSPAVAAALAPLEFAAVRVAGTATSDAMLALLK